MKVACMQPYFLPYIGYFQLISAVDKFVVYDNIKYTKKGWINRNRFLVNGLEAVFSLPLKKDSDSLNVNQRYLADSFVPEDLLNRFKEAYRKAPEFSSVMPLLGDIIYHPSTNLFEFIFSSIRLICNFLEIKTQLVISSSITCNHSLKSAERVQATCNSFGADTYINPVGGMDLYKKADFAENGINLKFIKALPYEYPQFGETFVPWLSVIDVLMFNSLVEIGQLIHKYDLEST